MNPVQIGEGTELQIGEDGKATLVKTQFHPGDRLMFASGRVYVMGEHNNLINPDRARRLRKKQRVRLRRKANG